MKFSTANGFEEVVTITADGFVSEGTEAITRLRKQSGYKWPTTLQLSYAELDLIVKGRQYREIVRYCELPENPDPLEVLGWLFAIGTVAAHYESPQDPTVLRTIGTRLIEAADALEKKE